MSGVAAPVQVAVKGINDADFKRSKAIMATQQGKGLAFPNQTEGKVQGPITDQQYRKAKESKVDYGIYEVKQTLEGQPTPLGVRVNFYVSLADSAFWAKDEATGIHFLKGQSMTFTSLDDMKKNTMNKCAVVE